MQIVATGEQDRQSEQEHPGQ